MHACGCGWSVGWSVSRLAGWLAICRWVSLFVACMRVAGVLMDGERVRIWLVRLLDATPA